MATVYSVSDQLEGSEVHHKKYRSEVVEYMKTHLDEFAPFYVGDMGKYLAKMSRNCVWGGNMELIAICRRYKVNIVIHQLDAPKYEILYHLGQPVRNIHLAYMDGNHYMSVRSIRDPGDAPAMAIGRGLEEKKEREAQRDGLMVKSKEEEKRDDGVKSVVQELGKLGEHADEGFIRDVLQWNDGNKDATVQFLRVELNDRMAVSDCKEKEDVKNNGKNKKKEEAKGSVKGNKCECGSGKKRKKCCGKIGKYAKRYKKGGIEEEEELKEGGDAFDSLESEIKQFKGNKKKRRKLEAEFEQLKMQVQNFENKIERKKEKIRKDKEKLEEIDRNAGPSIEAQRTIAI